MYGSCWHERQILAEKCVYIKACRQKYRVKEKPVFIQSLMLPSGKTLHQHPVISCVWDILVFFPFFFVSFDKTTNWAYMAIHPGVWLNDTQGSCTGYLNADTTVSRKLFSSLMRTGPSAAGHTVSVSCHCCYGCITPLCELHVRDARFLRITRHMFTNAAWSMICSLTRVTIKYVLCRRRSFIFSNTEERETSYDYKRRRTFAKKMRTKEENCLIYAFYGHLFITKLGFDDFNICKRMVQPF